jgi:hypothetical protein
MMGYPENTTDLDGLFEAQNWLVKGRGPIDRVVPEAILRHLVSDANRLLFRLGDRERDRLPYEVDHLFGEQRLIHCHAL